MRHYYNEHDPKAAAWLRELMRRGEIPEGHVDERSICDVRPDDLDGFVQCHFFAGIGGWSLALRLAGWPDDRPVWTGSCPCQPFSSAGKGLGEKDARHLWPVFFGLIRERRPEQVFGEQVASAIGKGWLDGVSADLEREGYAVGAAVLGAHSVGAPHIRQRLYWVADAEGSGRERGEGPAGPRGRAGAELGGGDGGLADAERDAGRAEPGHEPGERPAPGPAHAAMRGGTGGRLGDADGAGCEQRGRPVAIRAPRLAAERGGSSGRVADTGHGERGRPLLEGPSGNGATGRVEETNQPERCGPAGGLGDAAGDDERRAGQSDTGRGRDGALGGPGFWSGFDLLPCSDGKARRVEPGTFPLAHGVPGRVGLLRGYGNAINPWCAKEFIEAWGEGGGKR